MLPLDRLQNTIPSNIGQNKAFHILEMLVSLFSIEQNFMIPVSQLSGLAWVLGHTRNFGSTLLSPGNLFVCLFVFCSALVQKVCQNCPLHTPFRFLFGCIIMQKNEYKH